jgi:hypothetical protein
MAAQKQYPTPAESSGSEIRSTNPSGRLGENHGKVLNVLADVISAKVVYFKIDV